MQNRLTKITFGLLVLIGGLSSCAASYTGSNAGNQPLPSDQSSPSTVTQRSMDSEFAALEQSIHQQVNQYRKSRNLPPLSFAPQITQQARTHSQAMANGKASFSHNGFEGRAKAISRSLPYRSAAENIAYNQGYSDPDKQAVQGWLKSTGHRQNIEGNYDLTGIGVAKNTKGEYYFTQIFIKRR